MGNKRVYLSLTELFPQIDARILKAVAIEHPKDANEAAAVVVSEIVPSFSSTSGKNSAQAENKTPGYADELTAGNAVERDMQKSALTGSETGASSSGTIFEGVDCDHETEASTTKFLSNSNQLTNLIPNGDHDILSKLNIELEGLVESVMVSSQPPLFVQAGSTLIRDDEQGGEFHITGSQAEANTSVVSEDAMHKLVYPLDSAVTHKSSRSRFRFGSLSDEDEMVVSDGGQGGEFYITVNQAGASTSAISEDAAHNLVYPVDNLAITQKSSRSCFRFGRLGDESEDEETSKGSLVVENGDPELGGAFSSVVSRSTQGCDIGHLKQITEDAKSNKRTLFTVMELIMNLMREVELQEKDAEKAKEDAARGCSDTLDKVEELKKMLSHAKEANDMHAGEVYGERSILSTEVNELENRLLNLSEERDKSLSVLDEMRGSLETRLAAALEIKNAAEQEMQEKEGSARKALAEQEAIMEKVVQESKLLQQEAEENSKLREFLMDHGGIVDSLQGEISVICHDIRHLKEKFDNRVPLSESITSSQTSCKLASSGSSIKSLMLEKPSQPSFPSSEASYETPHETSSNNKSPKTSINEGKDERKELLEDGWDIFDKETDF